MSREKNVVSLGPTYPPACAYRDWQGVGCTRLGVVAAVSQLPTGECRALLCHEHASMLCSVMGFSVGGKPSHTPPDYGSAPPADDCLLCGAKRPSGHVLVRSGIHGRFAGRVCARHTLREVVLDPYSRLVLSLETAPLETATVPGPPTSPPSRPSDGAAGEPRTRQERRDDDGLRLGDTQSV